MESIGVRDLRRQVAAVLRRAAGGEVITVTVDGVPTAQIGPIAPNEGPTLDTLISTGLVLPPRRPGRIPVERPDVPVDLPVDVRLDRVLDALRGNA